MGEAHASLQTLRAGKEEVERALERLNELEGTGAAAFGRSRSVASSVRVVVASGAPLDREAVDAKVVAAALERNNTLTTLVLRANGIGHQGAVQ